MEKDKVLMGVEISAEQTIAELLSQWPEIIPVFIRHRMGCVGCSMSHYENLGDITRTYGLDYNQFLHEIYQAIQMGEIT